MITKISKKNRRTSLLILIDFVTAIISFLVANLLFVDIYNIPLYLQMFRSLSLVYAFICVAIFYSLKIYNNIWRYADVEQFAKIIAMNMLAGVIFIIYSFSIYGNFVVKLCIATTIISSLAFCILRMVYRLYKRAMIYKTATISQGQNMKNLAIIGAGQAGILLQNEILKQKDRIYNICCIIDDDIEKINKQYDGTPIVGPISDIENIIAKYKIQTIIVAIPSAGQLKQKEVLSLCSQTGCEVKYIPQVYTSIKDGGSNVLSDIKNVEIEDLLGRNQIKMDFSDVRNYIKDKKVIVTGGGGSIGSELCRQIMAYRPKELTIIDIYENNAYEIQMELIRKYGQYAPIDVIISSVRDKTRLNEIFEEKKPQIVFHAAAHKHVPLMERAPQEAIKNNVFGTLNTIEVSHQNNVEKFVLISTDKAVNPTNIMGASKRLSEIIMQSIDKNSKTEFVAVRFGNVLGSNGSVIPLFKKQIASGGPVTVTDPQITRFFMTIPEAVSLVLKSATLAQGGEIFVLDMGEPVKIKDLAYNLIRLSGLIPDKDIKVEYIGLRPGEKLYEELLISKNGVNKTKIEKIFIESEKDVIDIDLLEEKINILKELVKNDNNRQEIIDTMKQIVPTYNPRK